MRYYLLFGLLLLHLSALGQARKKPPRRPPPSYGGYKDMVVLDSTIWALGIMGTLSLSSCITRFEDFQARHVFHSNYQENYRTIGYDNTPRGEDIRAIAYSSAEQRLYYYSDHGIFRAKSATDLAKAGAWQLVCAPDGFSGQNYPSRGSEMGFTADNKLVFLAQSSAIGIWDGHVLRLIP
ncbi:hypothetical protein [Hymenobacter cellulosivorans]|uniref:Uncharacterized protein n=1 Tax=Hymenobacter cellulosivorans TaxID=2932249 RepID=A0ABY4F5U9_9BACT|nr:hypothetical protein [Hymenobacter cellulosivorans]UOQ51710.1 hypothetical protein MUN80_18335 [Hymenobacter cellulosivorans]